MRIAEDAENEVEVMLDEADLDFKYKVLDVELVGLAGE